MFLWYPKLAAIYKRIDDTLEIPHAFRVSQQFNLPFAAHAFNLGPYVQCWFHRDSRNFILGICPVLVLGNFNHKTSGHFIMVEARTIIELRPGDIFLLMSSIITHGTAPLRPGEKRLSWTCWTAGGIFRWWAAKKKLVKELSAEEHVAYERAANQLFVECWEALLTLEQLEELFAERYAQVRAAREQARVEASQKK